MESIRDDEHMVEARSNGGKHCGYTENWRKIGIQKEQHKEIGATDEISVAGALWKDAEASFLYLERLRVAN